MCDILCCEEIHNRVLLLPPEHNELKRMLEHRERGKVQRCSAVHARVCPASLNTPNGTQTVPPNYLVHAPPRVTSSLLLPFLPFCSVHFLSILFYSIPFCSVPFSSVPFRILLFCSVLFCSFHSKREEHSNSWRMFRLVMHWQGFCITRSNALARCMHHS